MKTSFALFDLGGGEIILILALILILGGARILPNMAKGLGSGVDEFRKQNAENQNENETWSRKEIFLLTVLVCLTAIEALALSNWLLE